MLMEEYIFLSDYRIKLYYMKRAKIALAAILGVSACVCGGYALLYAKNKKSEYKTENKTKNGKLESKIENKEPAIVGKTENKPPYKIKDKTEKQPEPNAEVKAPEKQASETPKPETKEIIKSEFEKIIAVTALKPITQEPIAQDSQKEIFEPTPEIYKKQPVKYNIKPKEGSIYSHTLSEIEKLLTEENVDFKDKKSIAKFIEQAKSSFTEEQLPYRKVADYLEKEKKVAKEDIPKKIEELLKDSEVIFVYGGKYDVHVVVRDKEPEFPGKKARIIYSRIVNNLDWKENMEEVLARALSTLGYTD